MVEYSRTEPEEVCWHCPENKHIEPRQTCTELRQARMILSTFSNPNTQFTPIRPLLLLGQQSSNWRLRRPKFNVRSTWSAFLSKQAAKMAQRKLILVTPTDVNKGGPKLCVFSQIIGVKQLFKAFPNSGIVIASPSAKASSFPTNQKDTKLAWAVIKLYDAIPNNIRPTSIVAQLLQAPPAATTAWKMTTPNERVTSPILTPRKSMRNPIMKVANMLGRAKMVYNISYWGQLMSNSVMMESWRACGLLKAY